VARVNPITAGAARDHCSRLADGATMNVAPTMTAIIDITNTTGAIAGAAMPLRFSVLALAALSISACKRPAEPVHLLIDERPIMDFADRACPPPQNPESPCVRKWQRVGGEFEGTLSTQFAALPACSGLLVATVNPYDFEAMQKILGDPTNPYWRLSVWFDAGANRQSWSLLFSPGPSKPLTIPVFQGEGEPRQIATEVCNIVRGRGGAVTN
jgi:hypothetical protein